MNNMIIDTHCHIQFNAYKDDGEVIIKKCADRNIILNAIGSQIDTSRRAVEFAEHYTNIYATVGLHPIHLFSTEVDEGEVSFKSREEEFDYEEYKKLALQPKTVGIGECGLELYHLPENIDREAILEKQRQAFFLQYKLAQEFDLPLVIHVREAHPEMIAFLKTLPNLKGVVHCYTGNWEYAQKYLDLGLYLGFTGVVTFPARKTNPQPQEELLEVVRKVPLDRVLIETDAPYLAPQAYRGKRCEPWMVVEVAKKIAEMRHLDLVEAQNMFSTNALSVFTKMRN